MTAARPALSISGLDIRYGDRHVLKGLDLTIPAGEVYGLLGANGAGKTTLIRAICGRVRPKSGIVRIADTQGSAGLRHIGLVPQEIALYPHLTVRENLEVFGRLSGMEKSAVAESIRWVSHEASLTARLDDPVEWLSGGWKRRVNIAAAVLHRPALLILDEPTVGVDAEARADLHTLISHLSQDGIGVLLTTHDLDQAETLCSTVGFLRNGVVAPEGHPRTLITSLFPGQKEITIELQSALADAHAQVLKDAGFTPYHAGLIWTRIGDDDGLSASSVAGPIEAEGIHVREVRFRDPGLQTVIRYHLRDVMIPVAEAKA